MQFVTKWMLLEYFEVEWKWTKSFLSFAPENQCQIMVHEDVRSTTYSYSGHIPSDSTCYMKALWNGEEYGFLKSLEFANLSKLTFLKKPLTTSSSLTFGATPSALRQIPKVTPLSPQTTHICILYMYTDPYKCEWHTSWPKNIRLWIQLLAVIEINWVFLSL